ncbi:MAG: copper resistance protein, partial [Inquilinus sp.]|nr:copper resistance protein [Inquilinus sp.]
MNLLRPRPGGRIVALLAAVVAFAPASVAEAATGRWSSIELEAGIFVDARLVAATQATGDLETVLAGVQVRLPEGWKTYWRSPGEAGLPPAVDWAASGNVGSVRFDWPAPHRFTLFGIDTFGYADEILFPLAVAPERPGEAVSLAGRLDLLVCSDICVPASFDLALDLPNGPAGMDARAANLINRFAAQVPDDGMAAGLSIDSVGATGGAEALTVQIAAREPFAAPDLFVEAAAGFSFAAPEFDLADGGRSLIARVALLQAPADGAPLPGLPVTVTVVDGARALEWHGVVTDPGSVGAAAGGSLGLAAILGLALLGGLILNLMPCVLPVLSLKLLSVLGHGGGAQHEVRRGFLASAAGILASFLVLAGAAIAVKAAGGAVGWGIQFQQPLFLIGMVVILTLFAANLLGWFEIVLPSAVGDAALKTSGGHGLGGHFATGAFAALLATPCSAPFLGTAVGFALSRGTVEILAVFAALGLGLALPYLAVAAMPGLATSLPRPGAWMVTLKRLLSLALAATAVWLLWVLTAQTGAAGAVAVGGLMVAMAAALWGRRRLSAGWRPVAAGVAIVLAIGAFAAPLPWADERRAGETATAELADWAPFDRAAIDRLVADGYVVFVDVTADWCITCQANKQLVLNRGAVAERLAGDDLVAMRADWTLPDDAIATYLADHGRYGIPFYAVYGPAAPDGVMLPELLTAETVLAAVGRAGGDRR